MLLMIERGMQPPPMSPAPAAFFSTTSESMEPQTSFEPQPDDVDFKVEIDATDIDAATTVKEDEAADDNNEDADDSNDADDLDD